MPQMVLNRNFVLSSTAGHAIGFRKGEPVNVPSPVVEEALRIGAEFTVVADKEKQFAEKAETPAAPQGDEREAAIFEAFRRMLKSGNREAFNGAGLPNIKLLRQTCGFDLDAAERNKLWDRFQDSGESLEPAPSTKD